MTCLCLEHLLCLLEAVMHLHFSPVYDVPLFRAPIMSSRSGDASEFLSCLYDVPSLRAPVNCVIAHSLFHSLLPTALLARWRWDVRMAERECVRGHMAGRFGVGRPCLVRVI